MKVSCFCGFCKEAGKGRGVDVQRALEGYRELAQLVSRSRKGDRPADGYFVSYWRTLIRFPEILAWEKLWIDGQQEMYRQIYSLVKSIRPEIQVGWHIWHNNSFSPFYRAEQDYREFSRYSDFLKIAAYNNSGGPRMADYIESAATTLFADFAPQGVLDLTYQMQNYSEKPLSQIRMSGLSSDYVYRETRRALAGVGPRVKVYPGIDVDVPTGEGEKKTEPKDVREAVGAALSAGAHGIILCRKYSEMRFENLRAVGEALRS